jgi:hypothetical protein
MIVSNCVDSAKASNDMPSGTMLREIRVVAAETEMVLRAQLPGRPGQKPEPMSFLEKLARARAELAAPADPCCHWNACAE